MERFPEAEAARGRSRGPHRPLRPLLRPALRARVRHHRRQLAAARAALEHRGRGHHRGARGGRAARVLAHPGGDGGHDRPHPEPEAGAPEDARRASQDAHAQDLGGGRGAGQAHHPRPRRRDPRPRGLHRHPRPGLHAVRRDAGQAGPRLRLRGQELRRGPLDRLDPGGLRPLAGQEGQLLRRERPRRPGHRLREAHPRGLDQRRGHAARRRRPRRQADEGPPHDLHQHRRRRRGGGRDAGRALRGRPRGVVGEAEQERRRDGAVRALLQLPQERQHPHHRRAGPEDRSRDAEDQELRPQVAQRDQGDPGRHGALPRHEARQLPAPQPRAPAGETSRSPPQAGAQDRRIGSRRCATWPPRCSSASASRPR